VSQCICQAAARRACPPEVTGARGTGARVAVPGMPALWRAGRRLLRAGCPRDRLCLSCECQRWPRRSHRDSCPPAAGSLPRAGGVSGRPRRTARSCAAAAGPCRERVVSGKALVMQAREGQAGEPRDAQACLLPGEM